MREGVRRAIARIDDPDAVALGGAACGGDLIFCAEWLATARPLELFLARGREEFLAESVRFCGPEWEVAFTEVTGHPHAVLRWPDAALRAVAEPGRVHAANNERIVAAALRVPPPLRGVFVWDGGSGLEGGTGHLVDLVRRAGGQIEVVTP